MKTSTHTLPLDATKDKVFAFLSDVESLPKWATVFCKELRRSPEGKDIVVTPRGEIFFQIQADPATGVIDMYGGPNENQMAYWPSRVVERPGGKSLYIFTAFQYPGMPDEEFEAQCSGIAEEFPNIKKHVQT